MTISGDNELPVGWKRSGHSTTRDGACAIITKWRGGQGLWGVAAGTRVWSLAGGLSGAGRLGVWTLADRPAEGTHKPRAGQAGRRHSFSRAWLLRTLTKPTAAVTNVAFSLDGSVALSRDANNAIRLSDKYGARMRMIQKPADWASVVSFSPNRRWILSGAVDDFTLRLWDLESEDCVRVFVGHTGLINSLAISTDERFAISASTCSVCE